MAAKKKSSKASSPSWRTLARQAKKEESEGMVNKAMTLRDQAAKMRRDQRAKAKTAAKAGPKKRTRKTPMTVSESIMFEDPKIAARKLQQAVNQAGAPAAQAQGWSPVLTHDELLAQNRAEEISKLARSKGGAKEQIAMRLACWNRIAEVEARKEAEVSNLETTKMLTKQMHINVVASFIAQVNGTAAANRGPLPRSMVISGYVLARVIDALNQAGYTEDGFKSDGIRRLDREGVVNDMVATRARR